MARPNWKSITPIRRFFMQTEIVLGECWEWTGTSITGYGVIYVNGRPVKAHRFSFEFFNGPIPRGHHICHRCDNPGCVNPAHLFAGTDKENTADMFSKGRGNSPRGTRNRHARLTEEQVLEIRRLHACGRRQSELAQEYGVETPAISKIVLGKNWRYLIPGGASE